MQKLGGRKFVGLVLVLAVGVALALLSKTGLTTDMTIFLVSMYGAFAVSNVSDTIAVLRGQPARAAAAGVDLSPVAIRLETIEAAITAATNPETQAQAQAEFAAITARIEHGISLQNQAIGKVLQVLTQPRG